MLSLLPSFQGCGWGEGSLPLWEGTSPPERGGSVKLLLWPACPQAAVVLWEDLWLSLVPMIQRGWDDLEIRLLLRPKDLVVGWMEGGESQDEEAGRDDFAP